MLCNIYSLVSINFEETIHFICAKKSIQEPIYTSTGLYTLLVMCMVYERQCQRVTCMLCLTVLPASLLWRRIRVFGSVRLLAPGYVTSMNAIDLLLPNATLSSHPPHFQCPSMPVGVVLFLTTDDWRLFFACTHEHCSSRPMLHACVTM